MYGAAAVGSSPAALLRSRVTGPLAADSVQPKLTDDLMASAHRQRLYERDPSLHTWVERSAPCLVCAPGEGIWGTTNDLGRVRLTDPKTSSPKWFLTRVAVVDTGPVTERRSGA
jgi:hypothetical protein